MVKTIRKWLKSVRVYFFIAAVIGFLNGITFLAAYVWSK